MPIKRADGITESERYLKLLCDCTFLSLWSYSGVFRDQGLGKGTEGKEVCDLLLMLRSFMNMKACDSCREHPQMRL